MKNRRIFSIVALLVLVAMLIPTFASCTQEANYEENEVQVYTIYSIKSDDTTDEAIREVELALNRIIFYRLGFCVKLCLFTEDEYEDAIAAKFEELTALEEAKAAEKKKKKTATESSEASEVSEESKVVRTGDRLLTDLENGIDTELSSPRLDILLVRGFDQYSKLVNEAKLTALDEKLSSEAKLIKDYVHPYFFQAAKIGTKTYGVPCNTTIGEYNYIVFNKELLDKYGYDAETMCSLNDLQEYLALIKENEPNYIPLQTAADSNEYAFMFENGFATYVDDTKHVVSSYEDDGLLSYLAMIARYNALGYFENAAGTTAETDPNAKFAVSFISGNDATIEALSASTGDEYAYNVYQVPTATNTNTIDSLLCVSKFCISNELDDVAKLLAMLYTDSQIQNLLCYGILNTNYTLDDNEQVVKLYNEDGVCTYGMNRIYAGNQFISYGLAGEPIDQWEKVKTQNRSAVISNTLGFSVKLDSFTYTDEDGKKQTVYGPDYCTILSEVIDEYYPTLMKGKSVDFDLEEFTAMATEQVYTDIRTALVSEYESKYKAQKSAEISADFEKTDEAKDLYKTAEDAIVASVKKSVKKKLKTALKKELQAKYKADGTTKSSSEIDAEAEAMITDEMLNEHLYDEYTEQQVNDLINAQYSKSISSKVNSKIAEFIASDEYAKALEDYANTDSFKAEVEARFAKTGNELVAQATDNNIASKISEISSEIISEFNTRLETAINDFVDEYADVLNLGGEEAPHLNKQKMLTEMKYYTETIPVDEDGEIIEGEDPTYETKYQSYYEFVWQGKIRAQYYQSYGDPDLAG